VAQCPDPAVLDAFVRGTLPWGTRMGIEGHIDTCADCAEVVSELARLFGSSQWDHGASSDGPPTDRGATFVPVTMEAPPEGLSVGRYRLGAQLGAGAMGMVFEAHDPQLHRQVAIKLLHPHVADGPDGTRLLREARAMAQLAHPNVVTVHDAGRVGAQVFVAMELVQGETLATWLEQRRPQRGSIMDVFVQAGRGLEAAHAVGIVHRDFKPENVMVGADGRARVADFGLARPSVTWAAGGTAVADAMAATLDGLTRQGAVVGTPAYMAPEQWKGTPADARSDQFAYCVALYEALCGQRPFEGRTLAALAASVASGRLRPMPRSVPKWLRTAVETGLALDPSARHPSMTALLRVLERDRGWGRRTAAVVGAMAIGAAATVGVLRWAADETTAPPPVVSLPAVVPAEPVPAQPAPQVAAGPDAACLAKAETVGGAWNGPRRVAYEDVLRRTEDSAEVRARTMPLLDRWAEGYATVAAPLCDPATAPALATARARCLDRVRAMFDALVTETGLQTSNGVERAATAAVYRLPDVAACGREPHLLAMPAAAPATLQGRATMVSDDVAGARALLWLAASVKAPAAADAALEQARALGHGPLLADALLAKGEVAFMRREVDLAIEALEEAVAVADVSESSEVRGKAATLLLVLHGALRPDAAATTRWRRVSGAWAERSGDAFVTAEVMRAEAAVLLAQLELEQADALLEEALPLHEQLYSPNHPLVATVHTLHAEVGLAQGTLDDAQRAAESALQIFEATVGPRDLQTLEAVRVAGEVAMAQGRLDDAESLARRSVDALALFSTLRHDIDRGHGLLLLGDVLRARGDFDAAEDAYTRAKVFHYQGRWPAYPLLRLSRLERQRGRSAQAVSLAREAHGVLDAHLAKDDVRRLAALRELGAAQRDHRAFGNARETLSAARALVSAEVGFGPLQSRSTIDLADLELAAGESSEALTLLDDAHVAWTGAYGLRHPKVVDRVLQRADLAWTLKKRDYAKRLYGSVLEALQVHRGSDDPAVVRARRRAR